MREDELQRARATLERLVEQGTRDSEDLRLRGESAGAERVRRLVETAHRLGDMLRGTSPSREATWSKHDDNKRINDDSPRVE
jgi:hypothetical protein